MSSEQHPSSAEVWRKRIGYTVVVGACAVGWWYDTFERVPEEPSPHVTIEEPVHITAPASNPQKIHL